MERKKSLFADSRNVYLENTEDPTRNVLQLLGYWGQMRI
jgi:hypothetical protein